METIDGEPVATRVSSTIEILTLILLELDMRTLLLSQRVSKLWEETIKSTHKIQEALFFEAAVPNMKNPEFTPNPLLAEAFPPFFTNRAITQVTQLKLPLHDKTTFSTLALAHPSQNTAFTRAGASWRRMLIRQPPPSRLCTFSTHLEASGGDGGEQWQQNFFMGTALSFPSPSSSTFPPPSDSGVRMGALYDHIFTSLKITGMRIVSNSHGGRNRWYSQLRRVNTTWGLCLQMRLHGSPCVGSRIMGRGWRRCCLRRGGGIRCGCMFVGICLRMCSGGIRSGMRGFGVWSIERGGLERGIGGFMGMEGMSCLRGMIIRLIGTRIRMGEQSIISRERSLRLMFFISVRY